MPIPESQFASFVVDGSNFEPLEFAKSRTFAESVYSRVTDSGEQT